MPRVGRTRPPGDEDKSMTPVIDLPPNLRTPTAAMVVVFEEHYQAVMPTASESNDGFAGDFPQGIDYDRWADVVRPSPREAFADRLELLDLFDDD